MSHLLADPTAVLVVAGPEAERERVRRVVTGGLATEVLEASSVEAAGAELSSREDVGCVVSLTAEATKPVERLRETLATVREHSDELPVVVIGGEDDVAAAAAAESDCRTLPTSATDDQLLAAVDDALETFEKRRREVAESSIFRTLLAESEVPLYAKDEQGRHLYKSDLNDDLRDPSEVVGKTDLDMAEEGFLDAARNTYADDMHVVESGEGLYEIEERAGRGDDEYWSLTTKVPWREDGEIQGLVGFSYDITRWKERERRLEAERRRIEQFTKYLAHDLRTPLQVAYGALDAAREGDEDAFGKVEEAHDRMRSIVEDLRGLSATPMNLSAGYDAVSVGIASTHLVPLVEDVWESLDTDGATLSVELPDDALVVARSGVIRPVVQTLLRNAVEHGSTSPDSQTRQDAVEHGGPDVCVTVGVTDDQSIVVEDDGPGFPEEVLTALSSDDHSDREVLGPGLLAVLETVEQQGWELTAGESANGGARVVIGDCPVVTKTLAAVDCAGSVSLSESVDVGDVARPGSSDYDPETDTWRVVGDGRNVWGDTHEFHFRYGVARQPVRVQGRITDLDAAHEFSKAGLAVRAEGDEPAPFGYVGVTGEHGSETTWRLARDGHTHSRQFEERPDAFSWYRVEYDGATVTCYLSPDGEDWRPVDQRSVDLGERVHLGLLVCSHSTDETAKATFADVTVCRLDA